MADIFKSSKTFGVLHKIRRGRAGVQLSQNEKLQNEWRTSHLSFNYQEHNDEI